MNVTKITTAAIKQANGTVWSLPRPARHHDVIHHMVESGCKVPVTVGAIQGFLTSDGTFVDRLEGRKIAEEADQLREGARATQWLFTEDIW